MAPFSFEMTESSAGMDCGSDTSAISAVGRSAAVTTLGCKVNTYESNVIAQGLRERGWSLVDDQKPADLYVVNSCTVTAEADKQTRQQIRKLLKNNPEAIVVVTGCYAQMNPSALSQIKGVRLVIGNDHKFSIPEICGNLVPGGDTEVLVGRVDDAAHAELAPLSGFSGRCRAFVQVQQGCDQSCTFCVIHQARGTSRSFESTKVLVQVAKLIGAGYREIVICGVDLGTYGMDLPGGASLGRGQGLVQLLKSICSVPGEFRVRISSIDPIHITSELLRLMADDRRICPHLHVSIQSGNDLILKRMKRRYDSRYLYDRLSEARDLISDLMLGADLMVGFPTESIDQFGDTLAVIQDLGISFPHVFSFSSREGTPAARIPRQVARVERRRRSEVLRAAGREVLDQNLGCWVGRRSVVLLERSAGQNRNGYNARLANYIPVRVDPGRRPPGEFMEVEIRGTENGCLIAEATSRE